LFQNPDNVIGLEWEDRNLLIDLITRSVYFLALWGFMDMNLGQTCELQRNKVYNIISKTLSYTEEQREQVSFVSHHIKNDIVVPYTLRPFNTAHGCPLIYDIKGLMETSMVSGTSF
jgi:hypothetical protein